MPFKCLRCGRCCKDIPLYRPEFDMFVHILKLEGKWDSDKAVFHPARNIWKIRGECPFLVENEDGSYSCRIYSFRPMICKLFPLSNECPTTKDKQNGETE